MEFMEFQGIGFCPIHGNSRKSWKFTETRSVYPFSVSVYMCVGLRACEKVIGSRFIVFPYLLGPDIQQSPGKSEVWQRGF